MAMDQETLDWIESHKNLIEWLRIAEERVIYGQIILNYHQGKISSYDICPRERLEAGEARAKIKGYAGTR